MQDIKSIQKRVRYILRHYPEVRRSDTELYIRYLEEFGVLGLTGSEHRTLIRLLRKASLPHYPTIWRYRQSIQSKEPQLVDFATARERRAIEKIYRKEFKR